MIDIIKQVVRNYMSNADISLKVGDKVLLLRQHGGQLFFVLDKV